MNEQIKLLVEYQNLDKEIKKLDDSVLKTEEAVKYYQAGKFLQGVSDALGELDVKAKALINKYNSVTTKIKELNDTFNDQLHALNAMPDDELSYVSKKYKERVNELNACEAELNAVIKELEALNKEYLRLGVENKKMREQFATYKPKYEELKNSIKPERDAVKAKQVKLEKAIDSDLMVKYNAKRKDKKFPIVYGITIDKKGFANCSACGNSFSVVTMNVLTSGELCECESCRSLIYAIEN